MDENDWRRVYVAGAFDWGGRLNVGISKNAPSRFGYRIEMELMFEKSTPEGPGLVDDFLTDLGLSPSINAYERKDGTERFRVKVTNRDDIAEFLEAVFPFLASRYEQAEILLEDLFPALEAGRHRESEEGFVEVVSIIDRISEQTAGHGKRRHTSESIAGELGVNL